MAKKGIDMASQFKFMNKDGKMFLRKAHNAGNSRNEARNHCIAQAMRGHHFGSKEAVRSAFTAAAKQCAGARAR